MGDLNKVVDFFPCKNIGFILNIVEINIDVDVVGAGVSCGLLCF